MELTKCEEQLLRNSPAWFNTMLVGKVNLKDVFDMIQKDIYRYKRAYITCAEERSCSGAFYMVSCTSQPANDKIMSMVGPSSACPKLRE